MPDIVVTVPRDVWSEWLDEGDLPGDPWTYQNHHFNLSGHVPPVVPGDRVYVVAHGRLRGYAPLVRIMAGRYWGPGDYEPTGFALVRRGGAVACTIDRPICGFPGWRYRDWMREEEVPFPAWRNEGVTD